MPSRELVYRIHIDTATGRREARNIRATFERELRQISVGRLDTSQLQGSVQQVRLLRQEFDNVGNAARRARQEAGGGFLDDQVGNFTNQLKSLAGAYLGLQGIVAAVDLSKLGTQALRTYASLNILAGGAEKAEDVLKAIQKASNGTVTEMEAAGIATQGFALKLARTPAEFEKLTRAAREITQVSPIINDVGEALTQLSLFASNEQSFMRADQLGLAVSEVKDRMAELRRENDALTGSQAKLLASIQILDEKYGATLDTVEAQASGLEKLRVAIDNTKVAFATADFGLGAEFFSIDKIANNGANIINIINGTYTEAQGAIDGLQRGIERLQNKQTAFFFPKDTTAEVEKQSHGLDLYKQAVEDVAKAVASGAPDAEKYQAALSEITFRIASTNQITDEQVAKLQELHSWYNETAIAVVNLADAERLRAENKITADQFENTRQATIFEQQPAIEQALATRAAKSAGVVGLEQAIATYRQQKALVDAAIQELIDSGVSDQNEIAIHVSNIVEQLTAPFDALEERVSQVDFVDLSGMFAGFDTAFVDFLPAIAEAREELSALSIELAYTGEISAEQAAQLEYLSAVAYAVADGGSQLSAVVNELGTEFLASNSYAAALAEQLFLAEAAFRSGQISADVYAGVTAVLSGNLLTLTSAAGMATDAVYALNQAQADMASAGGLAIGSSIANRVQAQEGASAREHNRREMDRYNREVERSAQAAARHQETSAKRAGKELETAAKRAGRELESALRGVEGLFDPSQVTDKDIEAAKLGTYTEKADEYLRRLRDEVENGVDWADVSIDDAKAALEKVGIRAGDSAEAILKQFEEAWSSSVLFSDKSNLSFINADAVKLQQDLADKAAEGEKNILEYFGIKVDEAVDIATGGGGGGYTPPEIKPPDLIDVDPITEGLQTGLDDTVQRTGDAIKQKLAESKPTFFDPANLFGSGKAGSIGPMANPEITVKADPAATAIISFLSGTKNKDGATVAPTMPAITPTIDVTAMQAELEKLTSSVSVQLAVTIEEIQLFRDTVKATVMPAVNVDLAVTDAEIIEYEQAIESKLSVDVGTRLHTTIEEIQLYKDTIAATVVPVVTVGLLIDDITKQTVIDDIAAIQAAITPAIVVAPPSTDGVATDNDISAINVATRLYTTIEEIQLFEDTVGATVKPLVEANLGASVATMSEFTVYLENNIPAPDVATRLYTTVEEIQLFTDSIEAIKATVTPNLNASPTALSDYVVAAETNMPAIDVGTRLHTTIEEIKLFTDGIEANVKPTVTIQLALEQPQQAQEGEEQTQTNAITPLLTNINTQIRAESEGIKREGATVAQILIAGMIAHFQAKQQGSEGQATTPLADALMTNISGQFSDTQNMFYAVGFIPAGHMERGFKDYAYEGLADSFMTKLTTEIRQNAGDLAQRGGTMAGYVQSGFVTAFSADTFKAQLIAIGELMYSYLEVGILAKVNGGALTNAIAAKVVEDIAVELEQP
jgi:hypothetical protein